jgi:hypothetical protein
MTTLGRIAVAVSLVGLAGGAAVQLRAGTQERVNPDAQVLAEFQKRIAAYMDVRAKVKKGAPKLEETPDPADIQAAQKSLAEGIRTARRDAKAGDIFSPEIRRKFRELMYPEVKGPDAAATKAAMKEDAPRPGTVRLKVNATYPETAPLPTVPPNILQNLPKLPEQLEYRVVGKHLILRDVDANVIVDYIPNAIS